MTICDVTFPFSNVCYTTFGDRTKVEIEWRESTARDAVSYEDQATGN